MFPYVIFGPFLLRCNFLNFSLHWGQLLFAVDHAAPCKVDQCFKSADLSNSEALS
jgi:hypothetical protein